MTVNSKSFIAGFFTERNGKSSMNRLLLFFSASVVVPIWAAVAIFAAIQSKPMPDIPVGVLGLITVFAAQHVISKPNEPVTATAPVVTPSPPPPTV